jgi:hypothetical protein
VACQLPAGHRPWGAAGRPPGGSRPTLLSSSFMQKFMFSMKEIHVVHGNNIEKVQITFSSYSI